MTTDPQREFLERAEQLDRHGMGIMPRGFLQRKMVDALETAGLLVYAGWGSHEETGVEAPMWRITEAGKQAIHEHRREKLSELTRMTEEVGGYDREREETEKP